VRTPLPIPIPLPVLTSDPIACDTLVWHMGGRQHLTVVAKATFEIVPGDAARLRAPLPLLRQDKFRADRWTLDEACEVVPYLGRVGVLLRGKVFSRSGWQSPPMVVVSLGIAKQAWVMYKRLIVQVDPSGAGPAGFGPIAPQWAPRSQYIPHGGGVTLPEPEIPEGFDWRYYQPAPSDQQFDEIKGDEWIFLEGMHPTQERIQTRFPGARVFARCTFPAGLGLMPRAETLPLVADLVLIDTDAMTLSIVFRGHCEFSPHTPRDQVRVVAGLEMPGKPVVFPPVEPVRLHPAPAAPNAVRSNADLLKELLPNAPAHVLAALNAPVAADGGATAAISSAASSRPIAPFELAAPGTRAPTAAIPGAPFRSSSDVFVPPPALRPPLVDEVTVAYSAPSQRVQTPPPDLAPPAPVLVDDEPTAALAPSSTSTSASPTPVSAPVQAKPMPAPPAPPPMRASPTRAPESSTMMEKIGLVVATRIRTGASLSDLVLAGADLRETDLSGAALERQNLRGANLSGVSLVGAMLIGADLSGADLSHADLTGADLSRADLSRAILAGANFDRARMESANLVSAQGVGVRFEGARLGQADLRNAKLTQCDFNRASLRGIIAGRADLSGSSFIRAILSDAGLRGARLVETNMASADVTNADLRDANLERANLYQVVRTTARLAGANLRGVVEEAPVEEL